MTTAKQIESNRRNALKSTGPRTAEGKTRSSLNGPLAQDATPSIEDHGDLKALRDAYATRFQPQGPVEECLVKRMAHAQWHRPRLANIQMGLMSHGLEDASEALTRCKGNLDPRSRARETRQLNNLARYEASLTRSSSLALRTLRALQRERQLEQK